MARRSLETDYLVVGRGRDGHGVHRRPDRPRRRARHARRPSPRAPAGTGRTPIRSSSSTRRRCSTASRRRCSAPAPCSSEGPEAGLQERARRSEIQTLLRRHPVSPLRRLGSRHLPRRRASTTPTAPSHLVTSRVSGETTRVEVRRRVVDATYLSPTIPATTPPPFGVADGVARRRRQRARRRWPRRRASYVIVGSGKTATDGIVWLLAQRRRRRTGSCGCGRVSRGCSTAPSSSPTRWWRSGWRRTPWRRPPTPSRSTTCSCASRPPA